MKKAGCLVVGIILLLTISVVASSDSIPVSVSKVAEKKKINIDEIQEIRKVDYENLPEQIDIENIDETNLEIYEVQHNTDKLFVLTFGEEKVVSKPSDIRQFLNFGFAGEMSESGFLKTASGVEGSMEQGYIMMRKGSITGMSTNLEVVNAIESGELRITIYKNGKAINFGNELSASLSGVKKDYDVQSKDVVTFEPGDVVSVKVETQDDIVWEDVITMIEITT